MDLDDADFAFHNGKAHAPFVDGELHPLIDATVQFLRMLPERTSP